MTDTVILLLAVLLAGIVLVILVRNGWRFSGLSTFAVSIIAAIVSTTGAYLALLVYLRFLSHSVWSQPERGVRGHQAPWPFTVWTAGILGVCFLVTLIIVCVLVNRKRSGPTRFAAPLLAPLVAAAVVVTGGSTFFALRIAPLSAGEARLSYAVWFRTQRAWRDVVDFNEGTAELTFREPYWLKFALSRDAKFFTPPEHQIGPPLEAQALPPAPIELLRGARLGVSYYSAALDPPTAPPSYITFEEWTTTSPVLSFSVRPIRPGIIKVNFVLTVNDIPFEDRLEVIAEVVESHQAQKISFRHDHSPLDLRADESSRRFTSSYLPPIDSLKNIRDLPLPDLTFHTSVHPGDNKFEINITLKGGYSQLNSHGTVVTEFTLANIDNYSSGLRGLLEDFIQKHPAAVQYSLAETTRDQLLGEFAELGHEIFLKLFSDEELYNEWLRLKPESIERVSQGDPMLLHVQPIDSDNWLLIPFNLIYDDPNFKRGDPVEPIHFWGYRFQIHINIGQTYGMDQVLSRPLRAGIAMADPDHSPVAQSDSVLASALRDQWKLFANLKTALAVTPIEYKYSHDFINVFYGQGEHDLLYFFGHSSDGSDLNSPSRAYFFIEDPGKTIPAATLEGAVKDKRQLIGNPVVIFNSCKGSVFQVHATDSFVRRLTIGLGARGFLGVETSVGINYAEHFSNKFFEDFTGDPRCPSIAGLLHKYRKEALENKTLSPFILLYTFYGNGFVRACSGASK